jgi:hypothetical protein
MKAPFPWFSPHCLRQRSLFDAEQPEMAYEAAGD